MIGASGGVGPATGVSPVTGASGTDLRRAFDSSYLLWVVLAMPAVWLLTERFILHGKVACILWAGDFAVWFLILTLMVTPVQCVTGPLPWLVQRRRYPGLASFGYAALHFIFWLAGTSLGGFLRSFLRVEILTG